MGGQVRIVGDWGTTRLRLFRLADGGPPERRDGPGIGQLAASPAETLAATVGPWRDDAAASGVLLCGMAGSRNGLAEVPYRACPADVGEWAAGALTVDGGGYRVTIAAGLSGSNFAGHADVMRGEETQIFGADTIDPALARGRHLLVMPGTHSKWVELADGTVERFHTFATGELFALLRDHSTLTRAGTDTSGREEGFAAGVARAEKGVLGELFTARAAQLVEGRSLGWALGLLSGLLIGGEIAEGRARAGGDATTLVLVGDPGLAALYAQAGAAQGVTVTAMDGDACALAGLALLAARKEQRA